MNYFNYKRGKGDWLLLGDANNEFFSSKNKERSIRNTRLCNLDSIGEPLTSCPRIAKEGLFYFENLFKARSIPTIDPWACRRWFPRQVMMDMNL